jgi:hypothetical protein
MRLVVLWLLVVSASALAGETFDLKHRFGVGGGAGWTIPVLSKEFTDMAKGDMTYNIHVRYHTSHSDSLQLNFQNYNFGDTNIGANVYDLMWINRINEYDKLTPIFGLGAGVADMNHISPYRDNLKFAGRLRIGFEYALTDDLFASLTADYQYIGQMPGNANGSGRSKVPGQEIHAVVPQLNLTLFFGHDKEMDKKVAAAPVAAATTTTTTTTTNDPAKLDTDGDGVVDAKDKCPNTAASAPVNGFGCAAGEKRVP